MRKRDEEELGRRMRKSFRISVYPSKIRQLYIVEKERVTSRYTEDNNPLRERRKKDRFCKYKNKAVYKPTSVTSYPAGALMPFRHRQIDIVTDRKHVHRTDGRTGWHAKSDIKTSLRPYSFSSAVNTSKSVMFMSLPAGGKIRKTRDSDLIRNQRKNITAHRNQSPPEVD